MGNHMVCSAMLAHPVQIVSPSCVNDRTLTDDEINGVFGKYL